MVNMQPRPPLTEESAEARVAEGVSFSDGLGVNHDCNAGLRVLANSANKSVCLWEMTCELLGFVFVFISVSSHP